MALPQVRQPSFRGQDKDQAAQLFRLRKKASGKAEQQNFPEFQAAMQGRTGDGAGLFKRGLEGWVRDGLKLDAYAKEKDARVHAYIPISSADLKATGTKDWESARRLVHGKKADDLEAGGEKIIPVMNLSVKQLTHTPLELTKKPPVLSIHLGYNELTSLNQRFFFMPMLKELNLDQNDLKDLPADWQYLTTLEILSIKNNRIETINHKFCSLTHLKELSLSYNAIKKLPHFWGNLCSLRALWVSGNALQSLPSDEIAKTNDYDPKTGEVLRQFSKGIGGLTSLEQLWVDCNEIPSIPKEIHECRALKYFNCRRNQIAELPAELGQLAHLEYLVASQNRIPAIPLAVCQLPALHTLQLESNQISEVPDYIVEATSLTELDLSNNPLVSVPSVVSLMPGLVSFKSANATKNPRGVCLTAGWSRHHTIPHKFPRVKHSVADGRPATVAIEYPRFRPSTSCSRLFPDHERSNPHGPAGPPPTRAGMRFAPVEVWSGDSEVRPTTLVTPGGRPPDGRRSTYSAPPLSTRPPSTPFSSSRPNTSGWSAGPSAHNGW